MRTAQPARLANSLKQVSLLVEAPVSAAIIHPLPQTPLSPVCILDVRFLRVAFRVINDRLYLIEFTEAPRRLCFIHVRLLCSPCMLLKIRFLCADTSFTFTFVLPRVYSAFTSYQPRWGS